jgi:23S rRNA (uracil1939-C5)-methyltransferase
MTTITLTLEKLTYGGEAMGRLEDGRAVFVPFCLPGERVRVRMLEEKRGFARAELIEVLEPSPQRIAPKCAHFGQCGGCHYQHLPYDEQCKAKTFILREQLERIGRIEKPPVQEIVPSPNPWNYRNHIQFHLTPEGRLGFQSPNAARLVPIRECHLPDADINALWPQLDLEAGLPFGRISLRSGSGADLMLVLESEADQPPELELEAGISVVHLAGDDAVVLAGSDSLVMEILGQTFRVSATSFFQANTRMAEELVTHVLSILPDEMDVLLDVYCGVGLFSAFLAPRCQRLIGIELSPSACEDFVANLDQFEHVELYEAEAEAVLPGLQVSPQVVVVDPPRSGLDRRTLDALPALGPERIVYISCDPSTLARDARRLIDGGYCLEQVTPFDLFPQTYHIESISLFRKSAA